MRASAGFLTIALLLAASPARAQDDPVLLADYVDTHRPEVTKRSLSATEKGRARELVAQLEAAPTEALLDALRPLANSGDTALMRAMWKGYDKVLFARGTEDDPNAWDARIILRAQWAIQLWQAGEQGRDIALSLSNCFGGPGPDGRLWMHRPCAYTATPSEKSRKRSEAFSTYVNKVNGKPDVTFAEARPERGPNWARRRFEEIVSRLREMKRPPDAMELRFVTFWAQREGPDMARFWGDLADLHNARGPVERTRAGQLAGAQATLLRSWNEIARKMIADKTISEADRDRWAQLSAQLGSFNLKGYAGYFPLTERWQVEAVCAEIGNPQDDLCTLSRTRQRLMSTRPAPGFDLPVRSYDMAGNVVRTVYVSPTALRYARR